MGNFLSGLFWELPHLVAVEHKLLFSPTARRGQSFCLGFASEAHFFRSFLIKSSLRFPHWERNRMENFFFHLSAHFATKEKLLWRNTDNDKKYKFCSIALKDSKLTSILLLKSIECYFLLISWSSVTIIIHFCFAFINSLSFWLAVFLSLCMFCCVFLYPIIDCYDSQQAGAAINCFSFIPNFQYVTFLGLQSSDCLHLSLLRPDSERKSRLSFPVTFLFCNTVGRNYDVLSLQRLRWSRC